jgi:phosphate transport system permease protein
MAQPVHPRATPNPAPEAPSAPASQPARRREETPRRRLVVDRAARWVVSAGGLAVVVAILGILVFIAAEIWPLLTRPEVTTRRNLEVPAGGIGAVLADEHRALVAALTAAGRVVVLRARDGRVISTTDLLPAPAPTLVRMATVPESHLLAGATADGRVVLTAVQFDSTFTGSTRETTARVGPPVALTLDPAGRPLATFAAQLDANGNATVVAQLAGGALAIVRRSSEKNEITGETSASLARQETPLALPLTALVLDADGKNLYGGTAAGELLWWPLDGAQVGPARTASAGRSSITALALLIGGRSLLVGQESGAISVWFPVHQANDTYRLSRVRDFPRHQGAPAAIRAFAPSPRDKGFLALSASRLGLYHSTSHRVLWSGPAPLQGGVALFYSPKADGAFLATAGQPGNPAIAGQPVKPAIAGKIAALDIVNPHPEISWATLFGKVWYEGYDRPAWVWQSSGASDDVEPKLSLTPLLAGTLKGTIYSLFLAIPLGVFGAMYTSQFMHPAYKRYLKPMVEIMASLPSVVLGFLAGLWLAPRIEKVVPALALMIVVLPFLVLAAGALWEGLPRAFRGRFPVGSEAVFFVFVLALGIRLCLALSRPFEAVAFGGNFPDWLTATTRLSFDQRNAVVVGLAMGFAVIPILFAIAEDAFSNVPQNLVAGSLALGADRWQTVTRVVLPTASPGIFSGVMVGFGRAIGETMIVLMATGNTPIMDWNPFNGFRTLSANIAVEIPEAPHGGTLYRTLFLAGLLLFVLTFIINTVAELVRQRLRERYSQL